MTTLPAPSPLHAETPNHLGERLSAFRRQVRVRLLLEGIAAFAGTAFGLALLTLILDHTFRLSLPARLVMLAIFAAGAIYVLWRQIVLPLRLPLDPLTVVSVLGDGHLTASVATVLESEGLPVRGSAAMVREAVARCRAALSAVDFDAHLDPRRSRASLAVIAAAVLLPMALAMLAPNMTRLWAERMFLGSNQPWPQNTYLQVAGMHDGVLIVPRGEPVVLRASARAGSVFPKQLAIRYREQNAGSIDANLTAFAENDFRFDFPSINAPTKVWLWGGDDEFGPFLIRPADRPRITELKLISQHPTEAKPTLHDFSSDDADLSFLPKTRLQLSFTANTPIAEAHLKSSGTAPSPADLRRIDDRHFQIVWTQASAVSLQIELVSADADLTSTPTTVSIGLKTDEPPRVTLAYSGVHPRVTARAMIPLTIQASDDYGVARAQLHLKIETPDPQNPGQLVGHETVTNLYGPVKPTADLQIEQSHPAELEPMHLPEGSLLTVSVSATDDCYAGPQTTTSRQVVFRIVPAEELFHDILLRQQAERARFRKQSEEAAALRDQLHMIGTAASAEEAAARHRAIQREVMRITQSLSDTVLEMRLNRLGTQETFTLMDKTILNPLKNLNDQLMTPQKDALDALQPGDARALSDVTDRQDQILSQMHEILKQMAQWDSFVDVLNQLNDVIHMQDQAQQGTEELKKQQTEGIFEK